MVFIDRYKELACAILRQAYYDYMYRDKYSPINDKKFKDFCFNSVWFDCLDIDRQSYYEKTMEKKRRYENGKEKRKEQ